MQSYYQQIVSSSYREVNKYLTSRFGKNNTNYALDILGRGESFLQTICLLPIWFNESFKQGARILKSDLMDISRANLKAWIGYTLYDYLRDGKISKEMTATTISIANICTQDALLTLTSKAKSNLDSKYISKLFNTIDLFYIRLEKRKLRKTISTVTFNQFCREISDKSIAAAITPLLVTPINFSNELVYKNILDFFKYYFTARQLSDDLDDFEKDLKFKILTPATILKNKGNSKKILTSFMRAEIDKNLIKAKKSIRKIPCFNYELFIEKYMKTC